MSRCLVCLLVICAFSNCWGQTPGAATRDESEYYVRAYAEHYHVPIPLVRAIVERESNWRVCAISPKGAAGLMQLMPKTAERLGVADRCNINQNVSGGVRYLAWLMRQFGNDLRLVSAAYYAGEGVIGRRGLTYHNQDVVRYVLNIRVSYLRQLPANSQVQKRPSKRDMR